MMDMGGVPLIGVDTHIDVGKNNKVMAVALDFHLITRSIEERRQRALAEEEEISGNSRIKKLQNSTSAIPPVQPDTSFVEKMANLLNINLGGDPTKDPTGKDDLSAISGNSDTSNKSALKSVTSPHMDIRSKYASKLRNRIDGGVAGLDLAKSEKEDTIQRGDASIHLAARDLISTEGMQGTANTSSTRWLATTGVGKLLSFVGARSMQIALLPLPSTSTHPLTDDCVEQTRKEMESITKQLPNIKFNLLVSDGRERGVGIDGANDTAAEHVVAHVLSKIDTVPPLKFLVVSDRDDYLGAARDSGMFTCRIRPKNKRRGNITTNYNVEDVGSVVDVINEINGISFNSALKG